MSQQQYKRAIGVALSSGWVATPLILREVVGESTPEQRRFRLVGYAWVAGRQVQVDSRGSRWLTMLGTEESKEWDEWDVEEQMIYIV
ncbi:hypothetical protein M406DRAFT_103802 [Cryphonectria parasitica EP155]|uniref:Uncharacterized protein n=1 Tax=Cryphonectria parasitica (strain ATCC 38755 / EP155) TaxID=660469 RepID=A0A9P4XYQ4_CRYP1|nr:uncharacterized protein M406DRAFT_103802 [Cryphonectria parasitica EP155]KAF3763361.1 hypothetical protein M406DRAFT_103802 [Cryphonectria parasitica EP155]